jgi:hypothetical protein
VVLTATPTCTPDATAVSKLTPIANIAAAAPGPSLSEIVLGALKSLAETMNYLFAGII